MIGSEDYYRLALDDHLLFATDVIAAFAEAFRARLRDDRLVSRPELDCGETVVKRAVMQNEPDGLIKAERCASATPQGGGGNVEDDERGVPSDAFREGRDVYIIYSFEDVAFHWGHATGRVLRRFKGDGRESETVNSNRLYMDAQMGGRLASREEYERY